MWRTAGKEEEEEPDAIGNVEASVWQPVKQGEVAPAPRCAIAAGQFGRYP